MKYLLRITLLSLLVGVSCTDLDENLRGDLAEDPGAPNNPGFGISENVNGSIPNDGLNAAYSRVLSGTAWHGSYFSVSEISTDEAVITQKGGDWFDGGIWLNMHRHDFLPTNPGLNGAWNDTYGGVTEANTLLASGTLDANQTAQLRVLRAFFYWKLMDLFGRIKIVTTPGVDAPQVDRPVVFQWIVDEINASIPDLATSNGYSRVNVYVAHALLSRLYLNAEVYTRPYPYVAGTGNATDPNGDNYYQLAIDHADIIINSGVYDLADNFDDVFGPKNVESIEHIFVAPFDEKTGGGMNFAQMTLHYPSQLTWDLAEQPWNGYSSLEEFYNSYDDNDLRKEAFFIAGPQTDQPDGSGNPILDVAFDKADPDGAPINYTPEINELAPNGSRQAGVRLGKFSFKLRQQNDMDNDYTLLRYAEVLMNKAEATARLNDNWSHPTTISLMNMVRARAGASAYTTLTEDEFIAERGREFFQESLRRTDLIRFDRWGDAWWEKSAHNNAYKNVMPIPLDQINATTDGSLTQHTDY
ncbi:MAG TPA: RagB/SusD family nutrient uptake outer membrane protein [Balneolaceae bacterium]|nr:RagB/SusD family nutrient uptake outer membrane protein [Balneolaceae bacterium]|tara:strand:- start:1691 stop:3271 length:1581 start_codon:yes stop_codon:yes gene_type:complete